MSLSNIQAMLDRCSCLTRGLIGFVTAFSRGNARTIEVRFSKATVRRIPPDATYTIRPDLANERVLMEQPGPVTISPTGSVPGLSEVLDEYGIEPGERVPVVRQKGRLVLRLDLAERNDGVKRLV